MKQRALVALLSCLFLALAAAHQYSYPFQNPTLPVQERAQDLLSRLTLQEKVAQMEFTAPAIDRLNVSAYIWGTECLRGFVNAPGGPTTAFVQAIGLAATFNPESVRLVARATSTEVHARHNELEKQGMPAASGISCWSPVVNIFRDPRWGRGQETYGECPYLSSEMAFAYVTGLQDGSDKKHPEVLAGCKHFDVHGGPEGTWAYQERFSFDAQVSKRDWIETFQPAFHSCIKAGAGSVMCSYNEINGIPSCANYELLTEVLRNQWNFTGYVVGDCGAIMFIYSAHKYVSSAEDAAVAALKAGADLECALEGNGQSFASLIGAVAAGKIKEQDIDVSLMRLITARIKLGLLDPPGYNPYDRLNDSAINTPAHQALALQVAKESIVLLKNEDNLLPLNPKTFDSICVIGPNANSNTSLLGDYSPIPAFIITPLQGITDYLKPLGKQVYYAQGCNDVYCQNVTSVSPILQKCDVAVVVIGLTGYGWGTAIEGEGNDRKDLNLPGLQNQLVMDVYHSKVPTVVVLVNGGPLAINQIQQHVPAILETWYPGQAAGQALAQTLFGDYSPAGRLPTTWYRTADDIPAITNYTMVGRTYRYFDRPVLYPFGYGLSYSKFEYSDLKLNATAVQVCESLQVNVTVTNVGNMTADEVVQFYVSDLQASVPVPIRQLQGFRRVTLSARGQEKKNGIPSSMVVSFVLTPEQMSVLRDPDLVREVAPGKRYLWVGAGQPLMATPGLGTYFAVVGSPTQCPSFQ